MADPTILNNPARLEALRATGLLDAPPSHTLERLTRLVSKLLHAPTAVVTLIDKDRQFFAASTRNGGKRTGPMTHSFCQHVADGADWRLRVRDTGRGIPPDQVNRVFEPFAQVQRADATEKGGTGLGLAIARAIVLQHGGRMRVESEVGKGRVFSCTIPAAT